MRYYATRVRISAAAPPIAMPAMTPADSLCGSGGLCAEVGVVVFVGDEIGPPRVTWRVKVGFHVSRLPSPAALP